MAKISIVYHHFPHYRAPVMRALAASGRNEYVFFGGLDEFQGIKPFVGDEVVKVNPIKMIRDDRKGKVDFCGFGKAIAKEYDAVIIIGNPNMIGAWRCALQARINGLKVLFWTHGWLKKEGWIKSRIRNVFYGLSDMVMTYGERAKTIGINSGFDGDKIMPIWNSLDWVAQSELYDSLKATSVAKLRSKNGMPVDGLIIATLSRITDVCKYEWLIVALSELQKRGINATLWMIGEGPALDSIKTLARKKSVSFCSVGAIYDEEKIAEQIMASDIVASPGKLGLTGIHSMAYGTPVITHGLLDLQMPEVEAIESGVSGEFFEYGSTDSLVEAIIRLSEWGKPRSEVREQCRDSLRGRFTPVDQVNAIDVALAKIFDH